MAETPGDELADAMVAHATSGARVAAGRFRAAIDRAQRKDRSETRALPLGQPKAAQPKKEPLFAQARPLAELLQEFKAMHAPVQNNTVAPLAPVAAASSSSAAAAADDNTHTIQAPISTQYNQELMSRYIAERVVEMSGMVSQMCPSPSAHRRCAFDAAYVRRLLSEPYAGFASCTNQACLGYSLPGRFALMALVMPDQMQHFDATGQLPAHQEPMCYLCTLSMLTTAVDLAASCKAGLRTINAPFFHPINAPGGYLPHAMHRSAMFESTVPITHPIRHVNTNEYVADERTVYVPTKFSQETTWVTEWEQRTIRGYSERADLMFGSDYVPAITQVSAPICIVGVGELPPCERVLADKFLPGQSYSVVPLSSVENASLNVMHLSLPLVLTLGGANRASNMLQVALPGSHPQDSLWMLCWCDLMVARARIIHMTNSAGGNHDSVARTLGLLPTMHKHFQMESPQSIQVRYSFKLHLVFYLLLTRLNEIARLLAWKEKGARQMDPPPQRGERDKVEQAMTKVGVEMQLKAYQASLQPMLEFFLERMKSGGAIDDTVFFMPGSRVLRVFELRPSPSPDYFSPAELTNYPLSVASIPLSAPGQVAGAAMNSLPPAARGEAPMDLYEGVFEPFKQSVESLDKQMPPNKAPCMAYWQPRADKFVFHVTDEVALSLAQVVGTDNDRDHDAWTQELFAALGNRDADAVVWRAIVYRINVASWLIHRTTTRLSKLDEELAEIGERANSWLPAQYTSELATRIYTAHANSSTSLPLDVLVRQVMHNMPRMSEDALPLLEEHRTLTDLVQALKRFISSHVPLVCQAVQRGHIADADMRKLFDEVVPTEHGAPDAVCDESMMCMASEVDGIEFLQDQSTSSIYTWVMAGVVPTSARVSELVARHRDAMESSGEYNEFARQLLYATWVGAYPHARNVAPFHVWLRAHMMLFSAPAEVTKAALDFYMDTQQTHNPATDQLETSERIFFLALREHFVRTLELAPAYQMLVVANYLAYPQFADNVRRHAEHLRSTSAQCSLVVANDVLVQMSNKSSQSWPTYHRPPASFPAFMTECCKDVDIDLAIEACERARCVLPPDQLRPPVDVIRGVGAYVESRVLPHEVYREQWMVDLGLSPEGVVAVNRLYAEHKGRAVNKSSGVVKLARLAAQRPTDYHIVAIFFTTMQAHIRRRVIPLDLEMAQKQQQALKEERNMAGVDHAGQCVLSSVQCCDTRRTFVIQDGQFQGTLPMRLNLDTNHKMCVTKRGKQYAPNRSGDMASQSTRMAMKLYFQLLDSPDRTELDRGELEERRTAMLTALRSHVQTISKGRYSLPCGTMQVSRWPALGYVTVHGDRGCTVCPRCGNKTDFSPGMFSTNGFTCGSCDQAMQDALERSHDDRCALCMQTAKAVAKLMRSDNSDRRRGMRDTVLEVLDDTAVEDVMTYREAWICAICNTERWLNGAARSFTLSELRWLRNNTESFKRQQVELFDPMDWDTLRRDISLGKKDDTVRFPTLQSATGMPKRSRIKRRMGTQRV